MRELKDNDKCYVCGRGNRLGLAVTFEINRESKTITARFIPRDDHQGYEGIVHGGILSSLLDEAMVKLAYSLGIPAVTAEMTVKFKASAAPGDDLMVTGTLLEETRRLVRAEARIVRGLAVIAEARGKLIRTGG